MRKPELKRPGAAPGASAPRVPQARAVQRAPLAAFQPSDDPIGPPANGDPQEVVEKELSELHAGFRSRMKEEANRFKTATDGSYYFVAAFESGDQCTAFLAACGVKIGEGDLFVDGRILADAMGVKLPVVPKPPTYAPRQDKRLSALVRRPKAS